MSFSMNWNAKCKSSVIVGEVPVTIDKYDYVNTGTGMRNVFKQLVQVT